MGQPRRILMVCMGNICRSPTAEVILRDKAKARGIALAVDSVGTENYHIGDPPDARSIQHALRRGYDLRPLRARQISDRDFAEFDIILAADDRNLLEITRRCPAEHRAKLALFLGTDPLPDPYYGTAEDFEKVLDLVEKRVDFLLASWWN